MMEYIQVNDLQYLLRNERFRPFLFSKTKMMKYAFKYLNYTNNARSGWWNWIQEEDMELD